MKDNPTTEVVTIVPSVLKKQVEDGWKLKQLAEEYKLPVMQMKKALKALGLTIRKFHAPKFEFAVEETVEITEDVVTQAQPEVSEEVEDETPVVRGASW